MAVLFSHSEGTDPGGRREVEGVVLRNGIYVIRHDETEPTDSPQEVK